MTAFNDIRDALMILIKAAYPTANVYGEEIQQGFDRPAFFVQLLPEGGTNINKAHIQKPMLVDICYFPAAGTVKKDREAWGVADGLNEALGISLAVGDRALYINEPKPEIVDQVLHYQFNVDFIDSRNVGIEVELDTGETDIMLSDSELGYVDGDVVPMREITIKGE